jgi:hypothetical protein
MSSSETPVNLTLQLSAGDVEDPESLDRLARHLLAEIQELEVESAALVKSGPAPEGAKSAELVTLGSLAVMVLPTIAPKLVDLLQSWAMRAENRTVKIKAQSADRSIEVEYSPAAMSTAELKQLLTSINRVLPPPTKS